MRGRAGGDVAELHGGGVAVDRPAFAGAVQVELDAFAGIHVTGPTSTPPVDTDVACPPMMRAAPSLIVHSWLPPLVKSK